MNATDSARYGTTSAARSGHEIGDFTRRKGFGHASIGTNATALQQDAVRPLGTALR